MKKLCLYLSLLFAALAVVCFSGCVSAAGTVTVTSNGAAPLSSEIIAKLKGAVFEVVVLKPAEGGVEYERPLPMESIPFALRNDKYIPVGTAFLMDDNHFYSAAHVFALFSESLFGDFYLRDVNGKTYKITRVVKYASNRDFIVFDAENFVPQPGMGLTAAKKDSLDTQVFSVGNALGEGIVIRDGILTSRTFEVENGEWKWLRFSAAASPGNSGGPLVNTDGEVLGIIAMKSENENLNYALPFGETAKVPANKAVFHLQYNYGLPNILNKKFHSVVDYTVDLPCDIALLHEALNAEYEKQVKGIVNGARKEFAFSGNKSFATSSGSLDIIYSSFFPSFPFTITLAENSKWGMYYPKEIAEYSLPSNGMVYSGSMLNVSMAYIRKPDTVELGELIDSPKIYMDYILQASRMYRNVGSEQVTITSYGDPVKTDTYTDSFGRMWNIAYWHLPFANVGVIAYSLPLPDGIYVMNKTAAVSDIYNGFNHDLAFMADYVIPRYTGTVKNWNEFLSLKPETYPLSPVFRNMKFENTASHTYLKTGPFEVDFPADVINLDEDSRLRLYVGYPFDGVRASEAIQAFDVYTRQNSDAYRSCAVLLSVKPPEDAPDKMQDAWEQKMNRVTPFNAVPFDSEQHTYYDEVLFLDGLDKSAKAKLNELYILVLELRGTGKNEEMKKFAEGAKSSIRSPSR